MALPKSKYSDPRHTPGKEYLLNGENYVGWYVVLFNGKAYTGRKFNRNSKLLKPVPVEGTATQNLFVTEVVEPDTVSREKGFWTRYFVQKKANLSIIEVSRKSYLKFQKQPQYSAQELKWKVQGPADDQVIKEYRYYGAEHVNRLNTQAIEKDIPGISSFIKDYKEFVE